MNPSTTRAINKQLDRLTKKIEVLEEHLDRDRKMIADDIRKHVLRPRDLEIIQKTFPNLLK